jgi:osmotically-inducible protein OsmY
MIERNRTMTKLSLTVIAAAGLALSLTTFLGCASNRTNESAGEYVDNSVITTKVKAAILDDSTLKSLQISVKTYKDVVQLSGFVDSAESVRRAGEVASGVSGVASVKNDLVVK